MVLAVHDPTRPWQAMTVGRGSRGPARACLGPLDAAEARAALDEMVGLYRAGLHAPLPLPLKTAERYAATRRRGTGGSVASARLAAAQEWDGGRFPGEGADAEHALLHGAEPALDVLTAQPPAAGETGAGWPTDETDRFGLLSRRLWDRLQAHERDRP
ncbi:hypothetical protein GCM10025868_24760 [Angustibacter aerolatus]|uniref:RecC C-terminal domain-containing protein n=1 Tax=Angustibacter aerolatus TaxID=1162965 RepID=A0ABQ6JI57_9ACTN|nr:hypothetical protein GCM10025868_24760 [Angustibacter aerolatus]